MREGLWLGLPQLMYKPKWIVTLPLSPMGSQNTWLQSLNELVQVDILDGGYERVQNGKTRYNF
jgi:hypothetical protein